MIVSDFSFNQFKKLLLSGDLVLKLDPFAIRIQSDIEQFAKDIHLLYQSFKCLPADDFADYTVAVLYGRGWERWVRPTAYFYFDDMPVFTPLPAYQATAMFEWGLNWCIAAHSHQFLIFHAAVIERNGHAAIFPAPPGSGKSTLCAALVNRGWRLLSDELALYDMAEQVLYGMARPVNLKNESIALIRKFEPNAKFTTEVPNTSKGTVALMQPSRESVFRVAEPATPKWVVTPKFSLNASATLKEKSRPETFMLMADQSFNYEMHEVNGFNALADLIDICDCYEFEYSLLDQAIHLFDNLRHS